MLNGRRSFGMPDISSSSVNDMFQTAGLATSLKNDDLHRQKELLRFKKSLEDQVSAQEQMEMAKQAINRGPGATNPRKHITVYAPPTQMQRQFREEEEDARNNKFRIAQYQAQNEGRLNTALATGRLRNEGLGLTAQAAAERAEADRTSRESVASGNRDAANKRAEEARRSAEKIAETSRNSVQVMIGPDGQPHAIASNPKEGTATRLTIDGQPVGDVYNPGTRPKPTLNPGQQKGVDLAQDALDEISNHLLKEDDSLTDKAMWGTGGSAWSGWIPGTQGRSGQASLKKVASEQVLNLIGHLKSQSRTGATGMGNMSDKDMAILNSAASKLSDPWLDEETIRVELVKIRNVLRNTVKMDNPTQPQSRSAPTGGTSKLSQYAFTAGPNETASVPSYDQPGRANLPIMNQGMAPANQPLRPDAAEFLRRAGGR